MSSKTDLLFFGSSHFNSRHNFGGKLLQTNSNPNIGQIKIISYPGKYLGKAEIESIIDHILCYKGSKLMIILMLSCNFLRKYPEKIKEIFENHCELIEKLKPFSFVKILLCGSIPSPRTVSFTEKPFQELDSKFQILAGTLGTKALFFDTAKLFTNINGTLRLELFKDGLHLNREGADILNTHLHDFITDYLN